MAGGGKVRIVDRDNTGEGAKVVNGRLLVSATGGGGGGGDVNITQYGGVAVGPSNPFYVDEVNGTVIDAGNSTTTPLSGGGNFTGTFVDLLGYHSVTITITTDADSATDEMIFEFSTNGSDVDDSYEFTFNASEGESRRFQFPVCARYFRVNYTTANGAPGNQGFFRVQTLLHKSDVLPSIHRLSDTVSADRSCTLVKGAIMARVNGAGDFVTIQASAGGVLKVTADVTSVTPGTGASNLGKAEDAAHSNSDVGVMALAVRNDTVSSLAGSNRDYIPLTTDSVGRLWVRNSDFTTIALSGSTRGRPIQITATASAGTTLHTATTTAGSVDRIYIYLTNTSTSAVTVTIEYGTTGAGFEVDVIVPANETILAIDGAVLGGAATDVVRAYASTGSVVNAFGRVERIPA